MPDNDNYFQRLMDRGKGGIERTQDSIRKAVGIGKTAPLGQVKLTPRQKVDYFQSQPDAKKLELWGQMDDAEKAEIGTGLMGNKQW